MKLEAQIGVELSIVFVCTVMVFLRIWARYRSQARRRTTLAFILSDIFLFISLLMGITGDSGRALNLIRRIRARDDPTAILVPFLDLPESEAVLSLQIDFFNTISWMVILWCAKAAFLCAFLDVASVMSKAVRTYLYLVIGITALAGIVVLVLILTACVPLQAYWEPTRQCFSAHQLKPAIINSTLHIFTELLVFLTSLYIIHSIRIGKRERYCLLFLAFLGFCTISIAVVRFLIQLKMVSPQESTTPQTRIALDDDFYLTSIAESGCVIVVACIPSLRALFRRQKRCDTWDGTGGDSTLRSANMNHWRDQSQIELEMGLTREIPESAHIPGPRSVSSCTSL